MSTSPDDKLPPTETLKPSATQTLSPFPSPTYGHDSPSQPILQNHQPSNSQSTDAETPSAVNPGDKRKRDDATPPDPPLHPLYKTSLCSYFRRHGASCSHGSSCSYAHGEEELRPRPDNTWDPTSEWAKKAIKLECDGNKCGVREEEKEEIMMTDVVADDGGGDEDGDGNGGLIYYWPS